MKSRFRVTGLIVFLLWLPAGCVQEQDAAPPPAPASNESLAFVDAHSHLVDGITADEEMDLFRQAGVAAVVIMHSDPRILLDVADRHPDLVIPFIGFRRSAGPDGIAFNEDTAAVFESLADAGAVCGFGEIGTTMNPPTDPTPAQTLLNPNRLKIYALAAERKIPLTSHVDLVTPDVIEAFETIAKTYPDMPLILAHAGFNAGPEVSARLLEGHPNVYIELSIRLEPLNGWGSPAAPGPNGPNRRTMLDADGQLLPAWRELMEQYPDRFIFAMDISSAGASGREQHIEELLDIAARAFGVLPRDARQAIARDNFEKLVADCPRSPL